MAIGTRKTGDRQDGLRKRTQIVTMIQAKGYQNLATEGGGLRLGKIQVLSESLGPERKWKIGKTCTHDYKPKSTIP